MVDWWPSIHDMHDGKALKCTTSEVLRNAQTAIQVLRTPFFLFRFSTSNLIPRKGDEDTLKKLNFGKSITTQKHMVEVLNGKVTALSCTATHSLPIYLTSYFIF